MVPTCALLPAAFWLDHDVRRDEFEKRLSEIGKTSNGWVTIARCNECQQVWRLDRPDRLQVDLAIKVPSADPAEWSSEEDRSVRAPVRRFSNCSLRSLRLIRLQLNLSGRWLCTSQSQLHDNIFSR
jgi:hypothetical protein